MKKIITRISLALLALVLLLLGATLFISLRYKKQIGEQLLSAVNNSLTTEARVQDFDLSLFQRFPSISASLIGLEVQDTRGERLCYAGALSATMSPFALFRNTLKIKSITLKDARINVLIDRQGNGNFDIFKSTEEDRKSGSMRISLAKAALEDIEVFYQDQLNDLRLEMLIADAALSGNFSPDQTTLQARAQFESRFLERGEDRFLVDVPLAYNGKVAVNSTEGDIQLNGLELQVGPNTFLVDGSILKASAGAEYDLELTSKNGSLAPIIEVLPNSVKDILQDVDSRGDFDLRATVTGKTADNELPSIQAAFSLEEGRISSPQFKDDLKDVSLLASFSNGKDRAARTSVFQIRKLKGYFNNELIQSRLKITNLENPYIQAFLDGVIPMRSIYPSFGSPNITGGSGEIEVKEVQLAGSFKDMIKTSRIHRVKANGRIEFDDAMLEINDNRLTIDRGQLVVDDNDLLLKDIKFEGPDTELEFKGFIQNLLPVLFADSLNSELAELTFQAELAGESLAIDKLLSSLDLGIDEEVREDLSKEEEAVVKARQVQTRERVTSLLNGLFDANIKSFTYGKIKGEDFQGKLRFNNNRVSIEGTTKAMQGSFELDGSFYFERYPRLVAELEGEQIDVGEFFRQCENFGQDILTGKQLNGTLNTKIAIESFFDELGNFEQDKLQVLAAIGIQDGELRQFQPLQQLAKVVKQKDLDQIRFSDLENFMEIRKNRIYIPVMFIQSNAINLTMNGVHGFDNSFTYNIKANVLQALGQKIRRHDGKLKPIKARKNGFVNLYFHIQGQDDAFEMESARRKVLEDFERSSRQRRSIRLALEDRFGYVKMVDEPIEWRDIPEYQEDPTDQGEEFIEWEGDN